MTSGYETFAMFTMLTSQFVSDGRISIGCVAPVSKNCYPNDSGLGGGPSMAKLLSGDAASKVADADAHGEGDHVGHATTTSRSVVSMGVLIISMVLSVVFTVLTYYNHDISLIWALPLYSFYGSICILVLSLYRWLTRNL